MDEEQESGSDLELEEDWEAVPTVGTHTEAQDGGVDGVNVLGRWNGTGSCPGASITISLTDEALKDEADGGTAATTAKPRPRGRVYSGAERAAAADVHRAHALCLLGRALLLDAAASDEALQAELLSLLPPQLAADAASAAAAEAPTADSWLPALLRWFHRRFTTLPLVDAATTSKGALRRQLIAEQQQQQQQQHLGRSNGEQHLVMMAQMRTCMDTRRGTAEQLAALLAATLRAAGFLTRSVWCLDALPLRPAAVEALARGQTIRSKPPAAAGGNHGGGNHGGGGAAAAGGGGRGGGRGGGSGHSSGRGVRDASEQKQQQQPAAKKQRGRSRARRGAASTADSTDNNDYDNGGDTKTASLRKGDAEFEAQLAMALASTAAEAEGRAAAAATAACTMTSQGGMMGRSGSSRRSPLPSLNPQLPPRGGGAGGGGGRSLPALIERGASVAALRAAAAPPPGFLWRPNDAAAAPTSWCEVYVGSSAHGRWLHVDGLLGCWDRPSVVEASTARRQPVSYVVACQGGAPKDVTRRYAANLPFTLRWRDEAWWSSTMTALRSSSIAHLPRSVAAQYHAPPSRHGIVAQAAGAAAAAAAQLHQHAAESHKTGEDDAAAGGGQASFVVQQQQQHIISGGGSGGGGNGSDPPTTTTTTTTTAAGGAALLRAVREEQELAATAARQTAAPPSSVEGFKDHPLYVLTRHIGQRQALVPGAAKLGLHKGEAYYARAAVQDCAPRLAWRRQGRDVRASELAAPAKRIKKRRRVMNTPSSSTTTSMRGGWGGWQRSSPVHTSAPEADEEAGGADEQLQQLLYGLWQTEPWSPPPAVGGIVPRNEHGNVEVPPLTCALPAGTVHIPLPGLLPVCRMLRIDAAPALVGFEVQAGRNLPKMLGVVVCLEHEQAVLEAYWARERDRAVEAETAAAEEAAAAWRRLLGHLWTRLRLQRAYGDGDGGRDRETADQGLAKQNSGGGTTAAAVVARLTCPSPTCVAATHSTVPGMQQKSIVPVDQPASVTAAAGVGATAASPQSHPHGEMMMQTNDAHLQHADGAVVDVEEF